MKSHKKFILQMLEKHGDSMSAKQIRGALGLNKSATPKLKADLQKLIKARKITKQGTHFFKIKDSKIKIKKNVQNESIKKINSKTKIKKNSGETVTGHFTRNQKGFGFVNIGIGRPDVFIGENEQGYAMEGDLVEIQIYRSRGFRGKRKGEVVRVLKRASKEILARLQRTKQETHAVPIKRNSGLPFLKIEQKHDLIELESGTLIMVEILEETNKLQKKSSILSG